MTFKRIILLLAFLVVVAYAAPQSGHYSHHQVEHKKEEHRHEEPYGHHPSYKFQYKVEDKKHGDYHGQTEHRDKDDTVGEYWLVEPDGHKRIVKYHVAKKSGFIAQVHRELVHHH